MAQRGDIFDFVTQGRICLDIQYRERRMYRASRFFAQLTDDVGYRVGNRYLVSMRQATAVAGLETREFDETITQRALQYPGHWGWLGRVMEIAGWRDSYLRDRVEHLGWSVAGHCSYLCQPGDSEDCIFDEILHGPVRPATLIMIPEDIVWTSQD
ncbi:hypothetical protein EK21DRAFT_95466 [Setomelanomma holmii]|uniref:Uncharacterized protein n=1 Tax=Setomelanomma holmii TaxID=210430 RepID=A0A9P4LF01_9PLEO|nr:hypothetical protein EK21DRAFT_95466 [Setomelanomma holmii]